MAWFQRQIALGAKPRGFNLVTLEVVQQLPELSNIRVGLFHLFIQHTSASLAINENADPTVRVDMETHFNRSVPEDGDYYQHTLEGPDDMTSHIKSVLIGNSVSIPITNGRLNLGTWQGIYLCEHRNRGGSRRLVATIQGESH